MKAVTHSDPSRSSTGRRPGRPTQRILTVDAIVERTLSIAGTEGFSAVTMNRLARDMGVTPRALYNHVANRQEIIDRVWYHLIDSIELPELDPVNWRESFNILWNSLRQQFRDHPRVLLVALDERVTPQSASPLRIAVAEKVLTFLTGTGLDLKEATVVREMLLADLFSFALTSDYTYNSFDEEQRRFAFNPVPRPWLEEHPDLEAPLCREALDDPIGSSDELFGHMVDARIAYVEKLLDRK